MSTGDKLKTIFKRIMASRPAKIILMFIFLAIGLLIAFRGCHISRGNENQLYHVARLKNFTSLDLLGKEANLLGFLDELISEIAFTQQLKIELITVSTGDLLSDLKHRNYDAVIIPISINALLQEHYYISQPLYIGGPVLVVAEDSPITSLQELSGKSIGIKKGSPLIFNLNKYTDAIFVPYNTIIEALRDLDSHLIYGVIMEAPLAYTYANGYYKDKIKVATAPLIDVGIRLIGYDEKRGDFLVQKFDEGLKKLHENGTYEKLIEKWEIVSP